MCRVIATSPCDRTALLIASSSRVAMIPPCTYPGGPSDGTRHPPQPHPVPAPTKKDLEPQPNFVRLPATKASVLRGVCQRRQILIRRCLHCAFPPASTSRYTSQSTFPPVSTIPILSSARCCSWSAPAN